jgi:hypothetical protein
VPQESAESLTTLHLAGLELEGPRLASIIRLGNWK